jgi:uncharacterized membrane protein
MLCAVIEAASENRIRELCAKAVSASDEDSDRVAAELRNAISTRIRFLRNMTKEMRERERATSLTGTAA